MLPERHAVNMFLQIEGIMFVSCHEYVLFPVECVDTNTHLNRTGFKQQKKEENNIHRHQELRKIGKP